LAALKKLGASFGGNAFFEKENLKEGMVKHKHKKTRELDLSKRGTHGVLRGKKKNEGSSLISGGYTSPQPEVTLG